MRTKISKKREPDTKQEVSSSKAWQLQAAKAQFSEVFRRARERAPQVVTKQGKEAVVILALEEFERLATRQTAEEPVTILCRITAGQVVHRPQTQTRLWPGGRTVSG